MGESVFLLGTAKHLRPGCSLEHQATKLWDMGPLLRDAKHGTRVAESVQQHSEVCHLSVAKIRCQAEEENLQQQLQSLLQETYPEQGPKNEGIPMVRIPKTGTPKLKSPRACKVPKTLNPKPQSLRALGHAKYRRLEGFRIFEPGVW